MVHGFFVKNSLVITRFLSIKPNFFLVFFLSMWGDLKAMSGGVVLEGYRYKWGCHGVGDTIGFGDGILGGLLSPDDFFVGCPPPPLASWVAVDTNPRWGLDDSENEEDEQANLDEEGACRTVQLVCPSG